jgi:transposase
VEDGDGQDGGWGRFERQRAARTGKFGVAASDSAGSGPTGADRFAGGEGVENKDICARVGASPNTVGKWRRRFAERRMEGLLDEPRPGAPRQIGDDEVAEIVRLTLEATPRDATHWSLRSLAKAVGLAPSTIHRIWKAFSRIAPRPSSCRPIPCSSKKCATSSAFTFRRPNAPLSCASTKRARFRRVMESNCQNVRSSGGSSATGAFQMINSTYTTDINGAVAYDRSISGNIVSGLAGQMDPATEAYAASYELRSHALLLESKSIDNPTVLDVRAVYQFGTGVGPSVAAADDSDNIAGRCHTRQE